MSTTLSELIDTRQQYLDAMRVALAAYPDAVLDGQHLASCTLKSADCDTLVVVRGEKEDSVRAGKTVNGVVVLMDTWRREPVWLLADKLREKHPKLYQQLVQVVAREA